MDQTMCYLPNGYPSNAYIPESWPAEKLLEFYEVCKNLDIGRGEKFIEIEQPSASFLQAREEYVREAPRASCVRKDLNVDVKSKVVLPIAYKKNSEVKEDRPPSPRPAEPELKPESEPIKVEAPLSEPPDLLVIN